MILILAAALLGSVCGEQGMSNQEILRRLEAAIVPGMHRSAVERELDRLPVTYVYVSRESLEVIGKTTNGNIELSGRFDVSTAYESRWIFTNRVAFFVDLDQQERVVEVRTHEVEFIL